MLQQRPALSRSVVCRSSARMRLSVGDCLVRDADADLLRSPRAWLNDVILEFVFEDLRLSAPPRAPPDSPAPAFLGPSATMLLRTCPELAPAIAGPLRLAAAPLVLCAVNDSQSPGVALSGTHWSLLAIWPGSHSAHLDSAGGHNAAAAARVADALRLAPGPMRAFRGVPQQRNPCDCGLFAAFHASQLVALHAHREGRGGPPPTEEEVCGWVEGAGERGEVLPGPALRDRLLRRMAELETTGAAGR